MPLALLIEDDPDARAFMKRALCVLNTDPR
jgi:hypothetical protein